MMTLTVACGWRVTTSSSSLWTVSLAIPLESKGLLASPLPVCSGKVSLLSCIATKQRESSTDMTTNNGSDNRHLMTDIKADRIKVSRYEQGRIEN